MTNETRMVETARHTPGPWRVVKAVEPDEFGNNMAGYRIRATTSIGETVIAETFPRPYLVDVSLANARLIAAAPALLAELEAIQWSGRPSEPMCPCCEYHRDEDGGHAEDCDLAIAIRAARGEE